MRKLLHKLGGILLFVLAFAPIPLVGGAKLLGSPGAAFALLAAAVPLALLLTLVPGRIGGKIKEEPVDNRPHRFDTESNQRFLAEDAARRSKPLRAPLCALVMLLFIAGAVLLRLPVLSAVRWPMRLVQGILTAALIPLALNLLIDEERLIPGAAVSGMVLYLAAGIFLVFEKDEALNRVLCALALCFLAAAALAMNRLALVHGAANRKSGRPSRRIVARNRLLLLVLAAVGALILYFDRLRQLVGDLAGKAAIWIWKVMNWLTDLFMGGETGSGEPGGGGSGDMLSGLPTGEAAPFWKAMEKVAMVIAGIGAVLIALWVLRKVGLLLYGLVKKLLEKMRGIGENLSEEYKDEQEQLDWGDMTRSVRDDLVKRVRRLTQREKKWGQMDAREKVRYLVRTLYRRAGKENLSSLTIREAAPRLKLESAAPEEVSSLYEQARYGREAPDEQSAERLRREVRA